MKNNALSFVRNKRDFAANSNEDLVWKCLLHNKSFKLDLTSSEDALIGFKEAYRIFKRIFSSKSGLEKIGNGHTLLISSLQGNQKVILEYVERSSHSEMAFILKKNAITGNYTAYSVPEKFQFLILALKVAVGCLFTKKDRTNKALLLRNVYEIDSTLSIIEKEKISEYFDFFPFEVDANLMSFLSSQKNVKVTFIPSLNPLRDHNQIMIADEIVLVTPYQEEERDRLFSKTIRCQKFLKWIPEAALSYIGLYQNTTFSKPEYLLGYYSHGSWIRLQGDHIGAAEMKEKEEWVLQQLATALDEINNQKVIIFLHPKEKKAGIEIITSYYSKFLGEKFEFAPFDKSSAQLFHHVEIGVAAYSSIVYERLFAGFKVIVGGQKDGVFPLKNSSLESIVFSSKDELTAMIKECEVLGNDAFFEQKGLLGYHHNSFQIPE